MLPFPLKFFSNLKKENGKKYCDVKTLMALKQWFWLIRLKRKEEKLNTQDCTKKLQKEVKMEIN